MAERLLVVADQLPWPPRNGLTLPLVHYLEQMAHTHELRLVLLRSVEEPLGEPERAENCRRYGPLVEATFRRQSRVRRVMNELAGSGMYQHGWIPDDLSALEALDATWRRAPALVSPVRALVRWQAARQAMPQLSPCRTVAAVGDCTAAEYHYRWRAPQPSLGGRLQALSHRLRSPLVARAEARLMQGADRVLMQTAADREALRTLVGAEAAARVLLAPNGVREELFALPEAQATAAEVLFVAELSGEYAPTAHWLLQQVWPAVRAAQPHARLTVVGRNAAPALRTAFATSPGVEHHDFVADLAPLYARSRVVLSPLWKGYGLINKTLEGLAAARAVVGGHAAFNGIEGFVEGRDGLALARPAASAMAEAVAALLADPIRAAALGRAGRERVRGVFRWERTAEVLREALSAARAELTPGTSVTERLRLG
ncbi:MAG: glycosyltransferase [Betaproteobacteria bacterium]